MLNNYTSSGSPPIFRVIGSGRLQIMEPHHFWMFLIFDFSRSFWCFLVFPIFENMFSKMFEKIFRRSKNIFFQNQKNWDIHPKWSPQKSIFVAIRPRTLSPDYRISCSEICQKSGKYLCFGTYSNGHHHYMTVSGPRSKGGGTDFPKSKWGGAWNHWSASCHSIKDK